MWASKYRKVGKVIVYMAIKAGVYNISHERNQSNPHRKVQTEFKDTIQMSKYRKLCITNMSAKVKILGRVVYLEA